MTLIRNTALALIVAAFAGPALADCDVAKGEKVYRDWVKHLRERAKIVLNPEVFPPVDGEPT